MSVDFEALHAQAKQRVGSVEREHLGRMTAKEFQRFAIASDDLNPRYLDDDAARVEGRAGAVAPPLFLTAVLSWEPGPPNDQLRPDGTGRREVTALPMDGVRLMGGGQDLELHADVLDGTEVVAETTLTDVELKHGRSGPLLLLRILRRYLDAAGAPLVTCRETVIAR